MKTFTSFRGISPDNSRHRHIDGPFGYQRHRMFNDHTITGESEFSIPSANVTEFNESDRNGYLIELAAPGYDRSNFDVSVKDEILTISGTTKEDRQRNHDSFYRREHNYATFTRSWNLPDSVDEEKISAKYHNGILEVFVPTHKPIEMTREPRRIEVAGA
jgi:HSP20 family protein